MLLLRRWTEDDSTSSATAVSNTTGGDAHVAYMFIDTVSRCPTTAPSTNVRVQAR